MHTKAKRNIYYTLGFTMAVHVITWSGNTFQFLLRAYGVYIDSNSLYFVLPVLAIYGSSLINPIIYTIKYERFRRAIRTECVCLSRLVPDAREETSASANGKTTMTLTQPKMVNVT
jgi:hypothetical protein